MSEENTAAIEEVTENTVSEDTSSSSPSEAEASTVSSADTPDTPPETTTETKPQNSAAKAKKTVKLSRGQEIQGKVKTITKFGAFIDIDLPQDGLVHISELSYERVEDVSKVVSVGDEVTVWVKNLDRERNRISLTMRKPFDRTYDNINVDDVFEGEITRIEGYGVFVEIGMEREGLVHVSELSHDYVKSPTDAVSIGDKVPVKVLKINRRRKQVNLSIKAMLQPPESEEEEIVEEEEMIEEEEVEMSTTMAAAFDRFNISDDEKPAKTRPEKTTKIAKDTSVMDDLVQRTLSTQQDD
ncbi:MAG: S1 RNA-binding domain-containing protein [Chloroflexota bacterium]